MIKSVDLDALEIPTLVFGGMTHLEYAACLAITMSPNEAACRGWLGALAPLLSYGHARHDEAAYVLALAASGLNALGLPDDDLATFPAAFVNGMTAPPRARALGDVGEYAPERWAWGNEQTRADATLLVYAHSAPALTVAIAAIHALPQAGAVMIGTPIWLEPRTKGNTNEPFGFRDGLSQPVIPGTPASRRSPLPDQIVAAGEFVLGYPDNRGYMPPVPSVGTVRPPGGYLPRLPDGRYDIGSNSSFLVIRQLRQEVKLFKEWAAARAAACGKPQDYIEAKVLGRWPDGSSLVRHPDHPGGRNDPCWRPDNDFRFGEEDPDGIACPRGAHIRRANPRDSLHPDDPAPISITNRHRILRVGRPYIAAPGALACGLLFMCLNADIERQFEFVQQSWLLRPSFDGLRNEVDPLVGHNKGAGSLTVPTEHGPVCLGGLPDFVTPIGGGYFWLPSRSGVQYLCST
jgi:deferrochelatase/peroxidase EfeB